MNIWEKSLHVWARDKAHTPALVDENHSLNYQELKSVTDKLTSLLQSHGLHSGQRVIVLLPRNVFSASVLITLLRKDLVGLFLDPKTNRNELEAIIHAVRPQAIITTNQDPGWHSTSIHDIEIFQNHLLRPRIYLLPEVGSSHAEAPPAELRWLLNTSGSTGTPKAVMISSDNLLARTQEEIQDFELQSDYTILNCLPFSHDLGLNQVLTSLYLGCTLRIKSKSVTKLSLYLNDLAIKGLTGTPLLWMEFLKNLSQSETFPHIKYISISGGKLELSKIKELVKVFPHAQILKTYGQTETFRTFINTKPDAEDLGQVASHVTIEVTPENELVHFGATNMLGYLFDSAGTDDRLMTSTEGRTGVLTRDLVQKSADGKYYFIGRKDDLIKRFEQSFHLSDVASIFKSHSSIAEAVALALPAEEGNWKQYYLGVFIELKSGMALDESELKTYADKQLSYYKVPDYFKIIKEYPRTTSYKIDLQKLKELMIKDKTIYADT